MNCRGLACVSLGARDASLRVEYKHEKTSKSNTKEIYIYHMKELGDKRQPIQKPRVRAIIGGGAARIATGSRPTQAS